MSVFDTLLCDFIKLPNTYTEKINDALKLALNNLDKYEEDFQNDKIVTHESTLKDKKLVTKLQSIIEDNGESPTTTEEKLKKSSPIIQSDNVKTSQECETQKVPKKRSKDEVDGMVSPEQDKRQKRNACVIAQSNISKQVNINLNQKLRREESTDKASSKSRRRGKDEEKENTEPLPVLLVKIKEEKLSEPPEILDEQSLQINIDKKPEDEFAMPPPVAPIPKTRKALQKEKSEESTEEETSRKRSTRSTKQSDTVPVARMPSARALRSSSRASTRATKQTSEDTVAETRPKRTRGKKKLSESENSRNTNSQILPNSGTESPAEKPRPKRTKRGKQAVEKQEEKPVDQEREPLISPKEEKLSEPPVQSPILQTTIKGKLNHVKDIPISKLQETILNSKEKTDIDILALNDGVEKILASNTGTTDGRDIAFDETKVLSPILKSALNSTVVLPNGVYNHVPLTPKAIQIDKTVVLEKHSRETVVLDKPTAHPVDVTVVLEKLQQDNKISEDNSLMTDDSDVPETPPRPIPTAQHTSAVKDKVQQFEQLASRVTRTKTKALANKDEETEYHTPPDKVTNGLLSVETLKKMDHLIFNGKHPQVSNSAAKPRTQIPLKTSMTQSASKISSMSKHREAAEELQRKNQEKEDAKRKKEAILQAKREMQKRKREEKIAAAAAARDAAERERLAAVRAAERERMEKQALVELSKQERQKEAERKKQEFARKVAETEERRKAEELARLKKHVEEKKAEAARRKQLEEVEVMKKEALMVEKEIEKRRKEYTEKQKMKYKAEVRPNNIPPPEPVYMLDGFDQLTSDDEDEEGAKYPTLPWSSSKGRLKQLAIQRHLPIRTIDRMFSVRAQTPDLREIFPGIEKACLKRTSSAVWRTPPRLSPLRE